MKKNLLKSAAVLGLVLVWLVLGCGEARTPFVGHYRSLEPFAGKKYAELDLKEDGKGAWMTGGKTLMEFTWVVNDGKPWFYLKNGGILIATPGDGGKRLSVDMSGDWHPGCPPRLLRGFSTGAGRRMNNPAYGC